MKNIQQLCDELGISRTTVYKYIRRLGIEVKKEGNIAFINDDDIEKIKEALSTASTNSLHTDYKIEYIQSLQQQIETLQKQVDFLKEQLRAKDEQIAKLIQTNQNFQVLLKEKEEQIFQLDGPKQKGSFLKKLFGR